MYTISDRGRALCACCCRASCSALRTQNITKEMKYQMQRLSHEHEKILKKMIALEELRAKL